MAFAGTQLGILVWQRDWLPFWEATHAVGTWLLFVVAAYYAALARDQLRITTDDVRLRHQPVVVLEHAPGDAAPMVLRNAGQGTAINVVTLRPGPDSAAQPVVTSHGAL